MKKGEPWQIIYTDLMTIIMVFFVILWSINQGKDIGISETVGDATTRMVSLPGDVLFKPGKKKLSKEGSGVFKTLFKDASGNVLNFDTGGLTNRLLVIHGHTDSDGKKSENIDLGYFRAKAAYLEIKKHGKQISDHVVICTHADNSPVTHVPKFKGRLTPAQRKLVREAKSKNRRITIEDKIVNNFEAE